MDKDLSQIVVVNESIYDAEKRIANYIIEDKELEHKEINDAISIIMKHRIDLVRILTIIGYIGNSVSVDGGKLSLNLAFGTANAEEKEYIFKNILSLLPSMLVNEEMKKIIQEFLDSSTTPDSSEIRTAINVFKEKIERFIK